MNRKRSIHINYSRLPTTSTLWEIEFNQTDNQSMINSIDETRINERCAELASTTYFGVCKSQLPLQSRNHSGELFPTLPCKENDYLISGNDRMLPVWCDNDWTYFWSIAVMSAYSWESLRLESKTITTPRSSLISSRIKWNLRTHNSSITLR